MAPAAKAYYVYAKRTSAHHSSWILVYTIDRAETISRTNPHCANSIRKEPILTYLVRMNLDYIIIVFLISRVSCQKGPTRHAYAWQIGPFWPDTLDIWVCMCSADSFHLGDQAHRFVTHLISLSSSNRKYQPFPCFHSFPLLLLCFWCDYKIIFCKFTGITKAVFFFTLPL